MTPERAKELLPVIQAFSEGKQVQVKDPMDKKWRNTVCPTFDSPYAYRIKPEVVRYRRYVAKLGGGYITTVLNSISMLTIEGVENSASFVRWIDTDWVEEEV